MQEAPGSGDFHFLHGAETENQSTLGDGILLQTMVRMGRG